jgi:hypothetical protein
MVSVEFSMMDTGDCAACRPVIYVGSKSATDGTQFVAATPVGKLAGEMASDANDVTLTDSWQTFKHDVLVRADGAIFVAVGWQGSSIAGRQPGTGSVGVDTLSVRIYPTP